MFKEYMHSTSEDEDTLEANASASAQPSYRATTVVYDADTGERIPKGEKIDAKKIISYQRAYDIWPHDIRTGEKLEWGATGEHIVSHRRLNALRPTDKDLGVFLPYGTPLGGNVVTHQDFCLNHTFVCSNGKIYKGELAKAEALSENPSLTFKSKRKIRLEKDSRRHALDANGNKVKRHYRKWLPYDAKTGKQLPGDTEIDGKKVLCYQSLIDRWPHDKRTGKKLEWGATGPHVVTYHRLNRSRPTNKATGDALPYGTPLGENVVTRYVFSQEHTFVGSDKKVYKGEEAKAKALLENPNLTFKSKKEVYAEKRKVKPIASALSATTDDWVDLVDGDIANSPTLDVALNKVVSSIPPQEQNQTEDVLALAANSPTLDLELNALLEEIDTTTSLVQQQVFMPGYDSATSDGTAAKQSKRNDSDIPPLDFLPHPSNR